MRKQALIATGLVVTLVGNMMGYTALGAVTPSKKEEVVYAVLEEDGTVKGVHVVNSFQGGDIVDYGNYSSVKNLTTTDKITLENDKVTLHTDNKKVYYQGDLKSKEIPWNVAISYKLDGVSYSGEELAGKSGKLELNMDITKNENCNENFWKGYALQATIVLDSNKCTNIQSKEASIANVGSKKQLTFLIMPEKGANIQVTADVKDFEMEGISINATKLNLDLDLDDKELTDTVKEMQDAISNLDEGAGKVNKGVEELAKGANSIYDGAKDLSKASGKIQTGGNSLVEGLNTLQGTIDTYYTSLSKGGIKNVKEYVKQHKQVIAAMHISSTQRALYGAYSAGGQSGVMAKLEELVKKGDSEATSLYQQYMQEEQNATIITNYVGNAGALINAEALLSADISYIQGSDKLIQGISQTLDTKKGALMTGANSLEENYETFHKGVNSLTSATKTLANSIVTLSGGTTALYNGTNEFQEETANMDSKITDKIDSTIANMTGKNVKTISFTSEKNKNIQSVLFVIKTPAIEKVEEEKKVEVKEEETGFFSKFLKLFKK